MLRLLEIREVLAGQVVEEVLSHLTVVRLGVIQVWVVLWVPLSGVSDCVDA